MSCESGIRSIVLIFARVALREGCVDRNSQAITKAAYSAVALREGCVDRNHSYSVLREV